MRTVIAVTSVVILIGVIVAGGCLPPGSRAGNCQASACDEGGVRAMAEGTFELGPLGKRR